MKETCREFLQALVNGSDVLQRTLHEAIAYWHPGDPPTTVLFAELGRAVVEEFDREDLNSRKKQFCLIEDAMKSDDAELRSAVAAGLIEAMIGRAVRNGVWERVCAELGSYSRRYAEAWINSPR